MTRTTPKVATALGMATSLGGILAFATAVYVLFQPFGLSQSLWLASLVGGLPVALLGAIVGVRYGNLERYHSYYDEETGRIEGHPMGRLLNPLARDNSRGGGPPGEFVPSRPLLAAICYLPTVGVIGFLFWAGVDDPLILGVGAVLFLGASTVAFVLAEVFARGTHDDYP